MGRFLIHGDGMLPGEPSLDPPEDPPYHSRCDECWEYFPDDDLSVYESNLVCEACLEELEEGGEKE